MEYMFLLLAFDVQTIPKLSKGQRFCKKEIRTNPTVVARIQEHIFCSVVKKLPVSSKSSSDLVYFIGIRLWKHYRSEFCVTWMRQTLLLCIFMSFKLY